MKCFCLTNVPSDLLITVLESVKSVNVPCKNSILIT